MRVRLSIPLLCAALLATCATPPTPPTPVASDAVPRCARADEAPLPDGRGETHCLRVGADASPARDTWASSAGLAEPVVYVRPDASAGGDGSRARPFATLSEALSRTPATVMLSVGLHLLDGPQSITSSVALVGAGASSTTLAARAGDALTVGAGGALRVTGLTVRFEDGAANDVGVHATAGASATLRDVAVEGAAVGVQSDGAALDVDGMTVRGARRAGVLVSAHGSARLRSVLVRDGAGVGVVAQDARMTLFRALVTGCASYGVLLSGAGGSDDGASDCTAADPLATAGNKDCLAQVASLANGTAALRVQGARSVEAREMTLAATRAVAGTPGGDGLGVSGGATLSLDPEVMSESRQGHGSLVVSNARAGVLIDGAGAASGATRMDLRGARVESNAGPGLLLQNAAAAGAVSFNVFDNNTAVGVGMARGTTIGEIGCNGFLRTRPGPFPAVLADGTPVASSRELADGLSVANATGMTIISNVFADNQRYGAVFLGATGDVRANRGTGNRYGLGVYNSPSLILSADNAVTGREPTPAALSGIASSAP